MKKHINNINNKGTVELSTLRMKGARNIGIRVGSIGNIGNISNISNISNIGAIGNVGYVGNEKQGVNLEVEVEVDLKADIRVNIESGLTIESDLTIEKMEKILDKVGKVLKEIDSIVDKGFVNNFDLGDARKYPTLSKYVKYFVSPETTIGKLEDKELIEITKWSYNCLLLDYYNYLNAIINQFKEGGEDGEKGDRCRDIAALMKEILNKLDPSIRVYLKKSGISILLNTYTGYDTEYQNVDSRTNKLLSVQLAVSSRILVKIPLNKINYKISAVDVSKGSLYDLKRISSLINYDRIEWVLKDRISGIRARNFKNNDESLEILIKGLKKLQIPYTENKNKNIVFMFEKTPVKKWFSTDVKEGVSLKDLVIKSNDMSEPNLEKGLDNLYNLFKDIFNNEMVSELPVVKDIFTDEFEDEEEDGGIIDRSLNKSKKFSRTNKQSFSKDKIVVTKIKTNYLIGHLTAADLSILKDFEDFKKEFDIVNGSFVTLKKPLLIDNVNLILRDTMLLAPGGSKSLASIGSLYGEGFNKIDIGDKIKDMEEFLKRDYESFKAYAMQDALICLTHALFMEEFHFRLGVVGIPLSLASLSSSYIKNKWLEDGYEGYQVSKEYLIGDASKTQTPKGLFSTGLIGIYLSLYIANYKGGRNESFMYGIDEKTKWFDYDLVSAYTTGMALLGDPDYGKARKLSEKDLKQKSKKDLILSYTIIKGRFKFPKTVKYPSIPCFVDKDITVYPLEGECILTGSEYLLAKEQGCEIKIKDIFYIPFKKIDDGTGNIIDAYKPFYSSIEDLQRLRSQYKKGTINNLIYKQLGNSLYGLVVKGISNKMKYDTRVGSAIRMDSSMLSNPIMASWITSFLRSVLGELLHNTGNLNGSIVSATTDGFITDIEDLESKLMNLPKNKINLFNMYRKSRENLSGDSTALEIKREGLKMISWTTRGQFSKESGIMAATGFQKGLYSMIELEKLLKDTMNSKNKEIVYLNHRLRSSLDVFKHGGHVTSVYKDQVFRLFYDNKRVIQEGGGDFLDSKPVQDIDQAELLRFLGKLPRKTMYEKNTTSVNSYKSTYKNTIDVVARNFIRNYLSGDLNLDNKYFKNYTELAEFVNNFDNSLKITPNIIAQLKRRPARPKIILKDSRSEKFVKYISEKFPSFNGSKFFNSN